MGSIKESFMLGFIANIILVPAIGIGLSEFGPWVAGAGVFAMGLCIGVFQGWGVKEISARTSGISALAAVGTLWAPTVLLTLGYSLIGVPLLIGYALVVALGTKFGSDLRLQQ